MLFQRVERRLPSFKQVGKTVARVALIAALLAAAFPFAARGAVSLWAAGRIRPIEDTHPRRVAIVFGALVYHNGRPSAMLADRVKAAAALYLAGKADVLLMTGGSAPGGYDEPGTMRDYALSLGVPIGAIVLDYAGQRTYDSCYRARHIFGVTEAVVVTQRFHLPRALMTCAALGIDAAGVPADDQRPWGYSRTSLTYSRIRELPATAIAVIDVLRRAEPPVMGEQRPIFPEKALE
jgi:SanA protein